MRMCIVQCWEPKKSAKDSNLKKTTGLCPSRSYYSMHFPVNSTRVNSASAACWCVEGFSTFLRFSNLDTLLPISVTVLEVQFQKIGKIRPHILYCMHARQSFHFQKITGTLKMNIMCVNLYCTSKKNLNFKLLLESSLKN